MEVRLFKIGGHEYVFRFGIVRKGLDKPIVKERVNRKPYIKGPVLEVPANKFSYNRNYISKNIGLKKYVSIMQKMPEILAYISKEPTDTNIVINKLIKDKVVDIRASELNIISRVHESNPLEDSTHKKWLLVNSGWGINSKISKKEV